MFVFDQIYLLMIKYLLCLEIICFFLTTHVFQSFYTANEQGSVFMFYPRSIFFQLYCGVKFLDNFKNRNSWIQITNLGKQVNCQILSNSNILESDSTTDDDRRFVNHHTLSPPSPDILRPDLVKTLLFPLLKTIFLYFKLNF